MSNREGLQTIKRHWILLLVCMLLGAALGWGISKATHPTFEARASLYFSLGLSQSATDLNQGATYTQSQMISVARLATTPIVLDPVIEELNLGTTSRALASTLEVTNPPDSVILQITASNASADQAADIANAVAEQLSEVVGRIGPESATERVVLTAQIVEQAVAPNAPATPNLRLNIITGALLGVLLGVLSGLVRERFEQRIRGVSDLARVTDAPVLGSLIVRTNGQRGHSAQQQVFTQYRRLRMGFGLTSIEGQGDVLVIAPATAFGDPSLVIRNIAAAFAETGAAVVLVKTEGQEDSNQDRAGAGLTNILKGEVTVDEALIGPTVETLYTRLGPGVATTDRSLLMASRSMRRLIGKLRTEFDVVIIDGPPLDVSADSIQLGLFGNGLVVLVEQSRARRRALTEAVTLLQSAGTFVRGVVLVRSVQGRPNRASHAGSAGTGATKSRFDGDQPPSIGSQQPELKAAGTGHDRL